MFLRPRPSALSVVRSLQAKPDLLAELRHLAVVPTEAGLVAMAEQEAPLRLGVLCLYLCRFSHLAVMSSRPVAARFTTSPMIWLVWKQSWEKGQRLDPRLGHIAQPKAGRAADDELATGDL